MFAAVVRGQDLAATVRQSRLAAGGRFGVTEADLLACEAEGVWERWAPLSQTHDSMKYRTTRRSR